ncbi:non-ribosomal peptide synthetase [Bradyrhizobium sp. CCBAU 21360]|uniref:non-ribosomal peptide synthetase n=1 Tax=Bradyrhizobium sp. CCBAU 21360 TaxID=1325081 RepID=UPI002305328F|nr:non-ribosomal peptide synthetase [Bradyrhizobium sp. CCBAU 21360]MDA9445799.1 multi-domain non-ribosomal peptide synthetase (NRPS domains from N to C-terminal:A, PP, C,A, PP) [Bradyrhizobium sp. CCBAU 21360]
MVGRVPTENQSGKKLSAERQPVDAITAINRLAASDPKRVALRHGADELTYEELRSRSDALASTLREQGARGAVVGYWGGRDLDWATAVIAILKAGSTYLPLDPSLPASRTSFMIEQSRCALLVGRDRPDSLSLFQKSSKAAPQFVAIEAALRGGQTSSVVPSPNVDGLAYILFTSGSTGEPKGAMIERGGLNNHLAAKIDALSLTRTDCVAQTASHCFDISLWQLLSGLCVGGSTSIIDDATLRSPSSLLQAIQRCGATVVQLVPSMLAVFVEYLQSLAAAERATDGLRIISTVGEPLTPGLARAWLALYPHVSILNHYGPTECADGVTHHLVSEPPALAEPYVPIGRPIQNVEVYVADGPRLCNVGEVGEICVSGVGVAAGYVNDHIRTKDAFGPNPFSNDPSFRRLYRTGDLGRVRSDGLLECLGRRDRQVKIRGHRIELGEIEARLSAHPLVHGAVAVASVCAGVKLTARDIAGSEAQAESRRLVAYVSAPAELAESDLQNCLAEALPSYMLPERIIHVSGIPLTRNGKVDFAALPDPGSVRPLLSTSFEEPQSDLEVRLRQIWSGILRIENIGVNDQFLSLGGDSLRAMLILGQLQTLLGVRADFRLVLNGTIRSLAASIEARTEPNPCTALTYRELDRSPLTRLQEHLWFLAQLDPSARNYIIQGGLTIKGNIDLARFDRAWTEVINSHQALSARFIDEDGPVQCFDAPPCTNLELIDASHLTSSETEELIAQLRRAELKNNFDLAQGRLFRARMVRFGPENHLILITAHEIILDAWSISVLLRDLQQRYLDAVAPRPEDRASLSGYAAWEKQHVSPEALENQRHYWRRQIGDDPPVLSLGRARTQTNSYRGGSHPVLLGSDLSSRVREFARQNSCTTSTTLLACFQLLLRMYSGQDDIVVGMPHAVRDQPGSADVIGFFLNMLPIRAAIDAGQSFAAHATRIQGLVSDAIANCAYPFGWMVRDTRLCREPGRSPIFQVMFNMYSEAAEPVGRDELALTFREYDTGYVKFDLTLYAQDHGDEIALQLAYAEDIFSSDLVVRMANNLRCLIAACVDKPLAPIEELSCLSASDVTLLNSLEGSRQPYESECLFVEAFEQISVSNHSKLAYFGEFGEVTFGQLRERVAAIRSFLRHLDVGAGDMVAMLVDRSPDVAAVMLAARTLHSIVVSIPPDYPPDRIQHILRDSQAKVLVHANTTETGFDIPSICLLTLDRCRAPKDNFESSDSPSDHQIANLIYTSSSTGRAKGVLIPEGAILNRLNWMWRCFPFDSTDVMVVQKSASLVASAWEYFGGLLRGVPTLILTQGQVLDPDLLLCSLAKHRVTRFFASPSLLSGIIGSQERQPQRTALKLVTSSAEPMPSSLPARWRASFPGVPLWNFYGATECASNAAVHETSDADDNSALVPVGLPIDNVKLYVLDSRLKRVPVGAPGELCIAGRCLSAGYWRDQDRNDRCFVPNPYDGGQYDVLYRSGDIARISTSGLLEICGRSDNQIKVRGFRIEPEEVEFALESHPAIAKAAVFAERIDEDRRLTASLKPARENLNTREILAHLRNRLPSPMVPTAFRLVDSVPLTTSGKIDRARLSSVPYREIETSPSAEPRTRNERVLARIWEDLLGAKGVGIDSSFFDIGGDSLLSVRCVTLARKAGLNLTVNQLYRTPTIRDLAAGEAEAAPHNVASADGLLPVPPVLSFWNSLLGFDEHFNIGDLFFLRGGILDIKILDRALAHVIERHEGLRLRVARTQDGLRLGIGPCPTERMVEEIDLVRMSGPDQRRTIESVSARRQHMFRFDGHTPLVHVAAFRTSESGDYYLLVLMHHFVADGMGYRLFLEALEGAYNALAAGHDVNGLETVQRLSPWLKRLEHYANSEAPDELKHWEDIDYDQFNLPVSEASSRGTNVAGGSVRELHDASLGGCQQDANGRSLPVDQAKYHLEIGGEATAFLLGIGARSARCEGFDVFLAALSGACGALFGNYSLWIDSLTSTRGRLFDDFDSSQIIGLVSELVPLPLNVTGRESRSDRARLIYRQRNALPRGGIGFRASKFLNRDPAVRCRLDRLPVPRIGVNYRAGLQRHFPRRFLDTDPYPLGIGEHMHQAAAIHLFWFEVGYKSGRLQIDTTYDPSMVDYEVTRHLCTVLQQELLQTINEIRKISGHLHP